MENSQCSRMVHTMYHSRHHRFCWLSASLALPSFWTCRTRAWPSVECIFALYAGVWKAQCVRKCGSHKIFQKKQTNPVKVNDFKCHFRWHGHRCFRWRPLRDLRCPQKTLGAVVVAQHPARSLRCAWWSELERRQERVHPCRVIE